MAASASPQVAAAPLVPEFCELPKDTFFTEHLRTTASDTASVSSSHIPCETNNMKCLAKIVDD